MISLRSALTQLNLTSVRSLETFTRIPDSSVRRQAARALIMHHHERLGGMGGRIGVPMGDLQPVDNGFIKPYSGGTIELLDFNDGPQGYQRYLAEVTFVGWRCHQQSENSPDNPYFIIGILGTNAETTTTRTFGPDPGPEETVTTGQNRFINEILTRDAQPPIKIFVTAMEHDSGSPAEASAKVEQSLKDATAKISLALTVLKLNPAFAVAGGIAQSLMTIFGSTLGDAASSVFGMGDDFIGENSITIPDWDSQKTGWLNPKPLTAPGFHRPFNVELVLDNGEGGRYSAFFQVNIFDVVKKLLPSEQ